MLTVDEFEIDDRRLRLEGVTVMEFLYGGWRIAEITTLDLANRIRDQLSSSGVKYRWDKPKENFEFKPETAKQIS